MKKVAKPFMVTAEQMENYLFTKRQKSAYEALVKAAERCKKSGLTLFSKQDNIHAYPSKFFENDMNVQSSEGKTAKNVFCPAMTGARIHDSGADDIEYIKDKFIK